MNPDLLVGEEPTPRRHDLTDTYIFPSFCKTTVEIKENIMFVSRLLLIPPLLCHVTEIEHITFNLKCIILKIFLLKSIAFSKLRVKIPMKLEFPN